MSANEMQGPADAGVNETERKVKHLTPKSPDLQARFWRLPAVMAYTQRSRSAIYRDETFPKQIRLSQNCVAWESSEVIKWADERVAARERAA